MSGMTISRSGFETTGAFHMSAPTSLQGMWKVRHVNKSRADLTGQRFGRLIALEYISEEGRDWKTPKWKCQCDCGNIVYVRPYSLISGNSKSCGCSRKGKSYPKMYEGEYTDSHRPRLYWTWLNMIRRCENPKSPDYYRYGGRGVSVCEEWHDLSTFLEWAYSHGWEEGLTLDRIDNEDMYCPENCRFADRITQANNKRTNRIIEYQGKTMSMTQWSRETGISPRAIYARLKSGWSIEDTLTKPLNQSKRRNKNGI